VSRCRKLDPFWILFLLACGVQIHCNNLSLISLFKKCTIVISPPGVVFVFQTFLPILVIVLLSSATLEPSSHFHLILFWSKPFQQQHKHPICISTARSSILLVWELVSCWSILLCFSYLFTIHGIMPRKAPTGKITKKTWCRPQKSKGSYVTAGRARPGDAPYLDLSEVCPNAFTFSLPLAIGPVTPPFEYQSLL